MHRRARHSRIDVASEVEAQWITQVGVRQMEQLRRTLAERHMPQVVGPWLVVACMTSTLVRNGVNWRV
jgi:hypothetical protein